jgi:hypothetical protein
MSVYVELGWLLLGCFGLAGHYYISGRSPVILGLSVILVIRCFNEICLS